MRRTKELNFKFELKDICEAGKFTGLAAVYGNVDQGGDVIDPGAFTKTLKDRNGQVPILWQHDSRQPIGLGMVSDAKEGLPIEGELVMEAPTAQVAYAMLKKGVIKGLSIGYDVISEKMQNGIRYLKEIKLYEVSLVTFPMNELATVSSVKSAEEFDSLLAHIREAVDCSPEMLQKFLALAGELSPPAAVYQGDAPDLHATFNSLKEAMTW